MKPLFRLLFGAAFMAIAATAASAQVIRIELTSPTNESATTYNPGAVPALATAVIVPAGGIESVTVTSSGSGYTAAPTVTIAPPVGAGTPATATAALVAGNIVITVTSPGSGYDLASPPSVTISPPAAGAQATATATVAVGQVTAVTLLSGGSGFVTPPAITVSGGNPTTPATATATVDPATGSVTSISFTPGAGYTSAPTLSIAPPPGIVVIAARNTGTTGAFSTQFFVDGKLVGTVASGPGLTPSVFWNPPQPGAYFITAQTSDAFGNTATALPVRVFVVGAKIFSPIARTAMPLGSSIVVSADGEVGTIAPNPFRNDEVVFTPGFIREIEFFVTHSPGGTPESIGTATTWPYSVRYTPGRLGFHSFTARAIDNNGQTFTSPDLVDVQVVPPIGTPPTVRIVNPGNNSSVAAGSGVNIIADAGWAATEPNAGRIVKVEFYVNGALIQTATAFPFTASWTPAVPGRYEFLALAFDDKGNAVTSAPTVVSVTGGFPTVAITSPSGSVEVVQGAIVPIAVQAAGPDGGIGSLRKIELLVDGVVSDSLPKSGEADGAGALVEPFVFNWKSNVSVGLHRVAVRVTDANNLSITSGEFLVNVLPNQRPQVAIIGPNTTVPLAINTAATIVAAASDPDGTVVSVEFFVNGVSIGTSTTSPFQTTWTPTTVGTFEVSARATDNGGATAMSAVVRFTVSPGQAPVVRLTAPRDGTVVALGSDTVVSATATDADGTVASVRFFADGVALGQAITTAPFQVTWNPGREGVIRITATAVDNAGNVVTSAPSDVLVVLPGALGGDTVYVGNYQGANETGRFALINLRGRAASMIAFSTNPAGRIYSFPALPVDASGNFTVTDATGRVTVSGMVNNTGVSGTIDGGRLTFIGIVTPSAGPITPRYYTGNLAERPASTLNAIVGGDGSITLYAADGTFQAAGSGMIDSTGSFNVITPAGIRIAGRADPASGFLTGTLTGGPGGAFTAAVTSGQPFSDGFLRNLSTRGQIGTGTNFLITGFVVGGTSPKEVLIRAIGPSLSAFGITGALPDPQLTLFSGNAQISSNDNWGGSAAVQNASARAGAFPLQPSSRDAAVLLTLPPGSYTAQVSGVSGAMGVALVEFYDMDNLVSFSANKVMNLSTRGLVGTGQAQLIAGFVVTGNSPKQVLIRGVGPALASAPFNLPGTLADPVLRLVRADNVLIRENDNWESGNDVLLVTDATTRVGAFPLAGGSRDAVILVSLPPGVYSAQLTGAGTSTGTGLIEIYEVR